MLYIVEIPDDFDFISGKTKTPTPHSTKLAWIRLYRLGKLKPIPKKKEDVGIRYNDLDNIPEDIEIKLRKQGYNWCIEEILGDYISQEEIVVECNSGTMTKGETE